MATPETIIGLLYSVKDSIGLRITEYEWPNDYNLNYFDFAVSFDYFGQSFIGRGIDQLESIGIEKAASEALEKLVCYTNKTDTVGLSVGIGYDCDKHAKFEAFERFYLSEHIEKKIRLTKHSISSSDLINNFKESNSDIEFNFFKMATPIDQYGMICVLKNGKSRSAGFAYSDNEKSAFEKSFVEALPNLAKIAKNDSLPAEIPWHLKTEFIDQIELLANTDSNSSVKKIEHPVLNEISINLDEILFLKESKIRVSKYLAKSLGRVKA